MKHPNMENLMKLFRLWAIVLSANFVGTFIAALFLWLPAFAQPGITEALSELSAHIMSVGAIDNIYRGIPAGILIAAIVWMIPMSRGFSFSPSLTFTYFISIGGFSHVVVGSCEAAYDVLVGNSSVADYFFKFLIPTGLGNILGGTGVFHTSCVGAGKKQKRIHKGAIMKTEDILSHVDHTLLKAAASWEEIRKLCDEAVKYHTASVCVPSSYVKKIRENYPRLTICTVVGFPLGNGNSESKAEETIHALDDGADEIDMVINIGAVKIKIMIWSRKKSPS